MGNNGQNGRTHEPSLRELTREVTALKEVLLAKLEVQQVQGNERDRRYEERFKATDDKTSLALSASEKAVAKAELATEKRFEGVNEFRATLSDQAARLYPRAEAEAKFRGYDEKFEDVKSQLSTSSGKESAVHSDRLQLNWMIGLAVVIVLGIIGILIRLK